jgi:hypothetical protein
VDPLRVIYLGDLVLTYDFRLAKVREVEYIQGKITGVKLSTNEWVDLCELVEVQRMGVRAIEILRERGRCTI